MPESPARHRGLLPHTQLVHHQVLGVGGGVVSGEDSDHGAAVLGAGSGEGQQCSSVITVVWCGV